MKKILTLGLLSLSSISLAQTLSIMSGESTISEEIQINIPYDPLEAETDIPTPWKPDEPKNINLNSATQVTSGPVLNMFIILALSLIISGYVYKKSQFLSK
jgi:hypothetical protein